jgi:hypothetical protein
MLSTLIMPCAGRSSRLGQDRPKWLLTHPNGNPMLIEALDGLDTTNVSKIVITLVKEHIERHRVDLVKISDRILELKGFQPEFLVLDDFTPSQSNTVYRTINEKDIVGPIFIKDCDNYFNTKIESKNYVCIASITADTNATNKSYVSFDKFGNLSGIIEKTIIGNRFCVGGYAFIDALAFKSTYDRIKSIQEISGKEIYISHIVQEMLLKNEVFGASEISNYLDWGTDTEWKKYISKFRTLLIDIDGCLIKNGAEFFDLKWEDADGLKNNIDTINKLFDGKKTMIVLTTSRKEKYREKTLNQLDRLGIKYHQIIFDLLHCQRVLINDFSTSNPYPSASVINVVRDADDLDSYL